MKLHFFAAVSFVLFRAGNAIKEVRDDMKIPFLAFCDHSTHTPFICPIFCISV